MVCSWNLPLSKLNYELSLFFVVISPLAQATMPQMPPACARVSGHHYDSCVIKAPLMRYAQEVNTRRSGARLQIILNADGQSAGNKGPRQNFAQCRHWQPGVKSADCRNVLWFRRQPSEEPVIPRCCCYPFILDTAETQRNSGQDALLLL